MNVSKRHIPNFIAGAFFGAFIGYITAPLFNIEIDPALKDVVNPRFMGAVFGAVLGIALSLIAIIIKEANDPNSEHAKNFTSINGIGSSLWGKHDHKEDGSYIATEWLSALWIPVVPICRYRVIQDQETKSIFGCNYTILEKLPIKASEVLKVYCIVAVIALAIYAYINF